MRARRSIFVLLLLILPLLGWTVGGGFAAGCAPAACPMTTGASCNMAHCSMHNGCRVSSAPQWTLPPQLAIMLPAAPVAISAAGRQLATLPRRGNANSAAGWLPSVFHPPLG